jgi:carboxymethylenebutenolidase
MILEESPVDLATRTGQMRAYLYVPVPTASADENRHYPGVVLYSEIYQQTGPIRRSAARLAGHGYVVLVPEVFHEHEPPGTALPYDATGTEKGNRYKYATPLSTYDNDARVALDFLAGHPRSNGRLGAIGWCLGGHLALRAAMNPDVLAAACFYATDVHTDSLGAGKRSDSLNRLRDVKGALMMVWGRQDPHVPDEGRAKIHGALRASGVNFSWHEWNAVHAFMRDEGPRFDPALAAIGWALTLEMFDRVLKG